MKYDFKIHCPKCHGSFTTKVDTSISKSYYPTNCPTCNHVIKVKVVTPVGRSTIRSPKEKTKSDRYKHMSTSKSSQHPSHPPHPPHPQHSPQFSSQHPIPIRPEPISRTIIEAHEVRPIDDKSGTKPDKNSGPFIKLYNPEKRLKIAAILMVIVFVLGLLNGINSFYQGISEDSGTNVSAKEAVDIQGKVIDFHSGRPIVGCDIIITGTGRSTVTKGDGQYFIPNVEAGEHKIIANAVGYTKITKTVTVDPELLGIINFELKEGAGSKSIDESVTLEEKKRDDFNSFAVFIIIFSIIGLLSFFLIYRRTFFFICSITAFISILSFGFGLGLVLGLIALCLILLSREGFLTENVKKKKNIGINGSSESM